MNTNGALSLAVTWIQEQGTKQHDRPKWWKIILSAVLSLAASAIVLYLERKLKGQSSAIANAFHERDVLLQEKRRAEVEKKIADNSAQIVRNNVIIAVADEKLLDANTKLQALATETRETLEKIDALKTWNDVNRYLAGIVAEKR